MSALQFALEKLDAIAATKSRRVSESDLQFARDAVAGMAASWPARSTGEAIEFTYLMHDCRDLAALLTSIADAAEREA